MFVRKMFFFFHFCYYYVFEEPERRDPAGGEAVGAGLWKPKHPGMKAALLSTHLDKIVHIPLGGF